jgi:CRP-like cAMP-binding protein
VIENLLTIVAERNLLYERKCGHLSHRTTREKLLSFLSEQSAEQKSAVFTIPFNRQELADYLSVDRSAMSAELSRMQADGLLRYEKSKFHLLKLK